MKCEFSLSFVEKVNSECVDVVSYECQSVFSKERSGVSENSLTVESSFENQSRRSRARLLHLIQPSLSYREPTEEQATPLKRKCSEQQTTTSSVLG